MNSLQSNREKIQFAINISLSNGKNYLSEIHIKNH